MRNLGKLLCILGIAVFSGANIMAQQVTGRDSKIQTTLDLYTRQDGDEARAAQGEYLMALGVATSRVQ